MAVASAKTDPTDFGSRQTGTTSDAVTYTITNTGGADLGLDSIELGGTNADQFDRTRSTRCLAAILPFGELGVRKSGTPDFKFKPTSTGVKTTSLQVASDVPTV